MFDLPGSAQVDRIVPKTKFYERAKVSTMVRDEFTNIIGRITWRYKLAESTLNIPADDKVREIQIFHVELKQKQMPMRALQLIDKSIPYPILFALTHETFTCYVVQHKLDTRRHYYKTEWNQLPQLALAGTRPEAVSQRIITQLILVDDAVELPTDASFDDIVATNTTREQLQKEIAALENKIRSERQFSRKVDLNIQLQQKKRALESL